MNRLLTIWQSLSGRILLIGISLITVLAIVVCIMLARFLLMDPPKSPINPLPPDEELIEFFYQHRAEIEELVRRYREYVPPQGKSHGEWEKMGNTKELFLQGGVKYISPIAPLWLPEPYSLEARQRDKGRVQNRDEVVRYQTLAIKLDDERFNRNIVWKDLVFMPALPRLENGKLIGPVGRRGGNYDLNVFTTLDNEPPDVKRDSCGMRLIEGQWFVRMCRINY